MTVDEKSIAAPSAVRTQDDRCPACTETTTSVAAEKESWIRCDFCKKWFHWRCVGEGGELAAIDKWYCGPCREENPKRVVTLKPPARKSSRKKPVRDYANLHVDAAAAAAGTNFADAQTWATTLASKAMVPDTFRRMAGAELSQEWLDTDPEAMRDPVVILDPEGLGMEMPSSDITVGRIATMLGADVPLEVIDVATQSGLAGWTLGRWAEYYESPERDKIRNVISLEISGTELGGMVLPPRLVREIDWVEKYWPSNRKGKGHVYPKVQLYCLMGVEGAWTDWHVDFAGSSVYYHILKGAKTFLFVRPTPANLAAYQRWSGSEMQSSTWLGDLVDEVIKVDLTAGNTMIIPTGWIHAVHTPVDALVFGGNFLNSYNAALQLKIRDIEIATRVPKKFRFPLFTKLSWYVGEKALRDLRAKEEFATRILESLEAVARFLVSQVHDMERGTEAARREAKDQVPGDRVKDPAAVARELRWRVRLALHMDSDSEEGGGSSGAVTRSSSKSVEAQPPPPASISARGVKRSRSAEENGLEDGAAGAEDAPFRNFRPKTWRCVRRTSEQSTDRRVRARPPPPHNGDGAEDEDEGWIGQWEPEAVVKSEEGSKETEVEMETEEQEAADAATVISKHVVTTRVRRTTTGIERHRVESVLEKWEWPDTKG